MGGGHATLDREAMSPAAFPTMYFAYDRRRSLVRPPTARQGITYTVRSPSTMKNNSMTSGS
jgi:hypothetical protein